MRTLRSDAGCDLLQGPEQETPIGCIKRGGSLSKRTKRRRIAAATRTGSVDDDLPSTVEVVGQRIKLLDGNSVGPVTFKMKRAHNPRDIPWVEFSPEVLHYLMHALPALEESATEHTRVSKTSVLIAG